QLKLGQQLTMTPQLQQAIRLLQLSTLDLQQEIQEALDSNPMLEVEESFDGHSSSDAGDEIDVDYPRQQEIAADANGVDSGLSFNEKESFGEKERDRKSTRLNSSHVKISYAVF